MTKQTEPLIINSLTSLAQAITAIDAEWRECHYIELVIKRKAKQRTDQQRKAIEVFCRELAKAFNDAGLDQRATLAAMREGVSIPWRQETVKDVIWRGIQEATVGKKSTTKLTTAEVSKIYDILNRWTSETFGLSVRFPEKK
jgi:hypothetical protein